MNPTFAEMIPSLNIIANEALSLWNIPDIATAKLINLSENATYLIEWETQIKILRINRIGYHSHLAILSEIAWINALLQENTIITAPIIPGKNGNPLQFFFHSASQQSYSMLLFEFLTGASPSQTSNLVENFEKLGMITAQLHLHSQKWQYQKNFTRLSWNIETMIGNAPHWGTWQNAPKMDKNAKNILNHAADKITKKLQKYGQTSNNFGLIHADLRIANLLIEDHKIKVIDFDDCGFSWLLYDLGAAFSFIEDHPEKETMIVAWLGGYQKIRPLDLDDIAQIPTFIMLRRMVLLGWIGSHHQTELALQQGKNFTEISCTLAEEFLQTH